MESATIESLDVLRTDSERDYRAAVFAAARGEEVNVESLRSILWPLEKTLTDFQGHVQRAKDRLDLAREVERGAGLDPDVQVAKAALEGAEREHTKAHEKAKQIVGDAVGKVIAARSAYDALVGRRREVQAVAQQLANSADPSLAKAIAELNGRRCELGHHVEAGRDAVARVARDESIIASDRKRAAHPAQLDDVFGLQTEADKIEAKLGKHREAVAKGEKAKQAIAEIDQELARLHDEQQRPELMNWD